ncbi:MAG: carboxylesterase/lipase family protein [Clostridia bacterium]|nr:carboxylesterase/lipase family protein [Clostridia bacterium]
MKHQFRRNGENAVVRTDKGLVRGYEYDGLVLFKGIPYAQAKRFHAPEETAPWEGVLDACSYGYVCPLMTNDQPRGELYVPHRFWPMDENCQNLNIWTPGLDDEKRPVLVWLHGGGYSAGSAIEHIAYDGANMSREGNAVVVSINHRLNLLGYFDLSDFGEEYENSGNAGGDDIIAALRWIRKNIAAFGGDPENVTVFGQSGGGAKVTTLLQSPEADGLFAKGIIMSGVIGPVLADAAGSGKEMAEAILAEMGLTTIRELETADYAAMARAYLKIRPKLAAEGKYTGCCPHPNAHYVGEPVTHGFRKESSGIPLMIGSVFGEFTSFQPMPGEWKTMSEAQQRGAVTAAWGGEAAEALIPLFLEAYPERRITDLLKLDYIFRMPEIRYIAERSKLNEKTWSYLFNMDQPIDGGNTPWHCSDIPYVFRNIDLVEYPHGDGADEGLAERIQEEAFRAVISFAAKGDPNGAGLPEWKASEPGKERTLILDGKTRVQENHDHRLMDALAGYLEAIEERARQNRGNIQH